MEKMTIASIRSMRQGPSLLIIVLLCFSIHTGIHGKEYELCKDWQHGRFDLLNTKADTFADVLRKDESWIKATESVEEYSSFIANKIVDEFNGTACDNTKNYFNAAQNKVVQFNMGRKSDMKNCVYTIQWSPNEDRDEAKRAKKLYDSLLLFDKRLTSNSIYLALQNYVNINMTAWMSNVYSVSTFSYDREDRFRTCEAIKLMTYRSEEKWFMDARVTNSDASIEELIDYERYYAGELIQLTGMGKLQSKSMYLNESCDINGNLSDPKSGTLFQARWKGKPSLNGFKNTLIEDSEALQKALKKTDFYAELVEDARLASSGAILLVPAVLAFFPLSLFQEVTLGTSIFYSAATDIVSVIPIFIKGVELYHFGARKSWGLVTEFIGNVDPGKVAIAQTNVAFCTMKTFVRTQGIIYICIGLSLMVLGISLEILAWKYLKSLKDRWLNEKRDIDEKPRDGAGVIWYWNFFQSNENK